MDGSMNATGIYEIPILLRGNCHMHTHCAGVVRFHVGDVCLISGWKSIASISHQEQSLKENKQIFKSLVSISSTN